MRHDEYKHMLRRQRFGLAQQTDQSVALLQDLHRCAVLMSIPMTMVLDTEKEVLVDSKLGAAWLVHETNSGHYREAGIEEAIRVLNGTAAVRVKKESVAKVIDLTGDSSVNNIIDLAMED